MEKNRFLLLLLLCGLLPIFGQAQTAMVCNALVQVSVDENCSATLKSEMILEGGPYCCYDDYIVEIDRVPPFGNGPWVVAVLDKVDIGKTYQVRVTDPASGNRCWSNISVSDRTPPKLNCTGLTVADLNPAGNVTLQIADMQVTALDACYDATEVTLKFTNNQTSVAYDCSDLGMNLISLTATDGIGNTSSCQANVLVRDPANYCIGPGSGCTTGCPPSQVVTFDHATDVLLPAFQANDFAPFDPYGHPTFDAACNAVDTTYEVTYTPTTTGQDWFTREWNLYLDGVPFPFGNCKQVVVFPSSRTFTFTGKVFVDTLLNCTYDAGEAGVPKFKVAATRLPSNERVEVATAADGTYVIVMEANLSDSDIEVNLQLPSGLYTSCPTVFSIAADTPQVQHTFDFGLYSEVQCPLMEVNIGNARLRRCFDNNIFNVIYANRGFQPAEDAYIIIEMDTLLSVVTSNRPYTTDGNLYTFQLGDVPAFSSGTFWVNTLVSCNSVLGQTLCADATIYPHAPCGGEEWAGPVVEARAVCEGDSVRLEVRNTGQQDMSEMLDFIVVEDIIMRTSGKFSLKAGEGTWVKMPANGSTWRIEAEQVSGFPAQDFPSAFLEACGGLNTPGLPTAFAMNDDPLYNDTECSLVVGSYDPNDKSAVPTGYNPEHIIRANTDLEYKIRFQNTGTDTAFTVVIVDTLSQLLDWNTIEAGVASHRYRMEVRQGGILRFVFDNILLPDSNVNEAASNGYVKFRIAQKPDLPNGTRIENKAAIYFDFNDPIITNTAFHTIGAPYVEVSSTHNPAMPNVTVAVRPNPFSDQALMEVKGHILSDGLLRLHDAQGRVVQTQIFVGNQCKIERNGLPSGIYFYQIMDGGTLVSTGKVQVH